MGPSVPKVILGQLGCSYGKSTILAVYANYLKELHKDAKVIVCTPTPWLKHQICTHFGLVRELEYIDSSNGLFLIEQQELESIPETALRKSILIVDEVDQLLSKEELMPYALKAQRLIGLSATLGGKVGL